MKVLLKRFHSNDHSAGFRPQIQKLELHAKQIVSCESTAEEVSFERSHRRISTTDSKVRTSLRDSFFYPGSERVNFSRMQSAVCESHFISRW